MPSVSSHGSCVVIAIEVAKDRKWRRGRELIFDDAMVSGGCLCVYNGGDSTEQREGERTSYRSKAEWEGGTG